MSDTLANLRRKIDGAVKLESVVRTMKAVAASSIGQYEAAVHALADYERSVQLGLSVCFRQSGLTPLISRSSSSAKVAGAIVFGSDQGLVGQFNEAMAEFVQKTLGAVQGEKKIWAVGERIYGRLADAGMAMAGQFGVPSSVNAITSLVGQLQIAVEAQESGYATIDVFYTKLASGAQYEPVSQRLLPLDAQWQKDLVKIQWPTKSLPELCGSEETNLRAFIREYLFITLFKACAESLASENASRLAAMQRAEKNIDSLMTDLNRTFYRLRQSSIDEELFDVIAGFNALSPRASGSAKHRKKSKP
jgi:F-type H+-transporting ATPase subunit gamma